MITFEQLKAFFKRMPGLLVAIAVLIVFLGGFVCGRSGTKNTTDTKTKQVVTTHDDHTVKFTQDQVNQQVAAALEQERATHTHTVVQETKLPNGTDEKTTTTDTTTDVKTEKKVDTNTTQTKIQYVDQIVHDTQTVVKTETKTVTSDKPQWDAHLHVGVDFSNVHVKTDAPYLAPLVVGGEINRRIAGPVFLGLWGNYTVPDASKNLPGHIQGGLSVGAQW